MAFLNSATKSLSVLLTFSSEREIPSPNTDLILLRFSMRDLTWAISTLELNGFAIYASAPQLSPDTLCSSREQAVSINTGIWEVFTSFFSLLQHSRPSMPGIITSQMIRSGILYMADWMPLVPLAASITVYSSQNNEPTNVRTSGLSSMTRIVLWNSSLFSSEDMSPSSDTTSSPEIRLTGSETAPSTGVTGNVTVNTVPFFWVLSTSIVPPCISTNVLTRARPMPLPPECDESIW